MKKMGFSLRRWLVVFGASLFGLSSFSQGVDSPIRTIYSPVVADDSSPDFFVYPDAFSLDSIIFPDPDAPTPDIWSFSGDGTYTINGHQPLDFQASEDPASPGAKQINLPGFDDPAAVDSDLRTLTFRNASLTPFTGLPVNPGAAGLVSNQTRVLTLFQSDGTVTNSKSFLVYTENEGTDRLSGYSPSLPDPGIFPGQEPFWSSSVFLGNPVFTTGTAGLCISVPFGTSDSNDGNWGTWTSAYGALELTKNSVYRIRIKVLGNPAISHTVTPLWDFAIDNFNPAFPEQKYGMDLINWDNNNSSANAAGPADGRHGFEIWWAPMAIQSEDWNDPATGEFSSAHDAYNDARFFFRVMDAPGAVDAEHDAGTICLENYDISRIDISQMMSPETPYYEGAPVAEQPDNPVSDSNMNVVASLFGNSETMVTNSGGVAIQPVHAGIGTIPPAAPELPGSWSKEIVMLSPGDANLNFADTNSIPDNYPIDWRSDQLLKITVGAIAPDQLGESNPPDVLSMSMDAPTSELGLQSFLSAGANLLGMPKMNGVTTYTAFFHTQARSNTPTSAYARLRPQFGFICNPGVLSGFQNVNNGGIKVTFMKVERIDIPGL